MTPADIQETFNRHWKPGWGSVSADEADFIQSLIVQHRPRSFLEIGMASGLSGGLIASFMEENGGERFLTIDHDNTFFGDKTKENGFLIGDIYLGSQVSVEKRPFTTALDLQSLGQAFDMAFIDANHQHPWPIIDTLCLYPSLTGPKIVIHHDLRLFRKQDLVFGIGPKYLFDQFPDSHKKRSIANDGNIFFIDLSLGKDMIENIAADAFNLPWSLRTPMQSKYVDAFRGILLNYYSSYLSDVFDDCVKKFNMMDRFRSGL